MFSLDKFEKACKKVLTEYQIRFETVSNLAQAGYNAGSIYQIYVRCWWNDRVVATYEFDSDMKPKVDIYGLGNNSNYRVKTVWSFVRMLRKATADEMAMRNMLEKYSSIIDEQKGLWRLAAIQSVLWFTQYWDESKIKDVIDKLKSRLDESKKDSETETDTKEA